VIDREKLAQFGNVFSGEEKPESDTGGFDMAGYILRHGFIVIRRKPWGSHPGGFIFELDQCPFNPDHRDGSAALTLVDGVPGFSCKHNGCDGKTIKDILALYAPLKRTNQKERTESQVLVELCKEVRLFHTPHGEAYARVAIDQHLENWPLGSASFSRWLVRQFHSALGKPPGAKPLRDAITLLEARAQFDSLEAQVWVRSAEHEGRIYVDLCNRTWEVVEIDADGWRVVSNPPVLFRRTKGMLPLVRPAPGGSVTLLRKFINAGDDDNWILCLSWVVAAIRAKGPYPILILHGGHGSAKSTMARILRRLTDPSVALVRSPPKSERDLMIAAANSWVLSYDNLSGIRPSLSDGLCRVATGGGLSTRELYTNSDEVFFDAVRPVILNGIDNLAERLDLADRAIVLNLPRIVQEDRLDEQQLFAGFENDLPQILGALFTAVSFALARLSDVRLACKPRMADFALWAAAAAPAFGFSVETFLTAYGLNRAEAVKENLEGDEVATAIIALVDKVAGDNQSAFWQGSCKELLTALEQAVNSEVREFNAWPKSARGLSGHLRRIATGLADVGVDVRFDPKSTHGRRPVTISGRSQQTATSATIAASAAAD
jgi:hypothetical protein